MQNTQLLDAIPIWGMFPMILLLVLVSVECGFRIGRWRSQKGADVKDASTGSMVGAVLGLLAFMLAFTFGMVSARYDARRQAVREEASAVQTAFLRAGFVPEPRRAEIRTLLCEYVEARLAAVRQPDIEPVLVRSREIHDRLWAAAAAEAEKNPGSVAAGLFVQSLNELIELHTKRVQAALRGRIPPVITYVLYLLTVLGMSSMGYLAGLAGKRTHFISGTLAVAFSSVMFLIVDLDRPREGLLQVSQQVMIDLQNTLATPRP
ncbi:MAG: DUF4239 domain-containing protein [Verrucomicrobia bacterium]|nr:DUF4239 domain-containing protein [Verrucomicrobiota bacterium]